MAGRVSQLPVEVSGSGQDPVAHVSQLVVEVSSLTGAIYVDQDSRFNNTNTFPAGGTVATAGIPVVQAATFDNVNSFPAGGAVTVMTPLPIVQAAPYTNPNSFFVGGQVAISIPPPPVTPGAAGGSIAMSVDRKQGRFAPRPRNQYDDALLQQANLIRSMFHDSTPVDQTLNGLGDVGTWGPGGGAGRESRIPLIQSSGVPGPESIYTSARQFFEKGAIVTPGPLLNDVLVLEFKVPTGYWGKILGMYLHYTGTGFVPGSGDIIWRVQIGRRWMKGFGNTLFNMGSFENTTPLSEWQGLRSQRVVRVWVNVPNLSGAIQVGASRILAGVQGWFYSNEEVSGV